MSLLKEIQDAAVDSKTDILTVLRKCRVLASRLSNDELKSWVQKELDGYKSDDSLPDYRVMKCQSQGHFIGHFGAELKNAPISSINIPEDYRDALTTAEFKQSISALVDLTKLESICGEWPAEAYQLFGNRFYKDMVLVYAHKVIPRNFVISIIETVRNRVLNFALEIEAANPQAGETTPGSKPLSEKIVSQIFNTNIVGNVGNLATGGSHFAQTATVQIAAGDAKALRESLKSIGVSDPEADELELAIKSDPPLKAKTGFGNKVAQWIGKMVGKSAQGLLKVSTEVAAETLSKTIKSYCGLPPSE
jgi:hypothetical protein